MRITLFALLTLGLSTAPAFAGARIHRLYHAPIQPQRAVLQKPHAMFHESAVAPLPGKTIPMLPTSRPLPPPQAPAAIAESDIPADEPIISDVGSARTLPIIPVTARTSAASSSSAQPVLSHPRARYSGRVVAPTASTVVVPVASQLTVGTVHAPSQVLPPAPAPEPQTLKVTKPAPQPIAAPVTAPEPAPQPVVTPAAKPAVAPAAAPMPTPTPAPTKPHRRLPIAPVA